MFTDRSAALSLLKQHKTARFKVCPTLQEAQAFATCQQVELKCSRVNCTVKWPYHLTSSSPLQVEARPVDVPDSPRPSEGSLHKSLTPQEEVKSRHTLLLYMIQYSLQYIVLVIIYSTRYNLQYSVTRNSTISAFQVKFRKAIEASPSDLDYMRECVAANPRYLVSGADSPVILHQGSRHNALHVAAKLGREEAARLVLAWVQGGGLMARMYPEEDSAVSEKRTQHLTDLYINMHDKGAGDTPLHLAVKFGRLSMVRLLCSLPQTQLEAANRQQERPREVVASRREVQEEVRAEIVAVLEGEVAIPVYESEGVKTLGRPLAWREATELLDSPCVKSRNRSSASESSLVSSPGLPSPLRSPLLLPHSPLSSRSPLLSLPSPASPSPLVSALLGPMSQGRALALHHSWKVEGSRQRLEDPVLGAERKGRELARREEVAWREYWPWLGEYADISSQEGLARLEGYLEAREEERELRERMEELEGEEEKGEDNEVFRLQEDTVDNMGEVELVSSLSAPLSPLSSLSRELDNLNLVRTGPGGGLDCTVTSEQYR